MEENNKKRSVAVIAVFLLLLLLGLGYAALTTTLNINGTATVKKQTWSIKLQNPNVTTGSVTATKNPAVTVSGTTCEYGMTLEKPGDFFEFTIEATNDGTIDAKIGDTPIISGVSTEMEPIVNYTVTYEDGTAVAKDDTLNAGTTKKFKVRVEYDRDIDADTLNGINWGTTTPEGGGNPVPNTSVNLTLTYSVPYVQA